MVKDISDIISYDALIGEIENCADSLRDKRDKIADDNWLESAKLDREICGL